MKDFGSTVKTVAKACITWASAQHMQNATILGLLSFVLSKTTGNVTQNINIMLCRNPEEFIENSDRCRKDLISPNLQKLWRSTMGWNPFWRIILNIEVKKSVPQVICNSHYGNGAPAKGKPCPKPHSLITAVLSCHGEKCFPYVFIT